MATRQFTYQFSEDRNAYLILDDDGDKDDAYGAAPTTGTLLPFLIVQSKNKREGGIRPRYGVWHSEVVVPGRQPVKIYENIPILSRAGAQALQTAIDNNTPREETFKGLTWKCKKVVLQQPFEADYVAPPPPPTP